MPTASTLATTDAITAAVADRLVQLRGEALRAGVVAVASEAARLHASLRNPSSTERGITAAEVVVAACDLPAAGPLAAPLYHLGIAARALHEARLRPSTQIAGEWRERARRALDAAVRGSPIG